MDFLPYLIVGLVLLPVMVNLISQTYPKIVLNKLYFLSPILLLGLSVWSFVLKTPITITFFEVSTFFSVGLKFDVLSGIIATTVSTIGIVVSRFSVRYLEDDQNYKKFHQNLAYTLSCVLTMLMAPNLVLFFMAWVGTSYFLHHMLTHFEDREEANKAAHQKFWVSRFGDLFILSAGAVLFITFKTLEFDRIFAISQDLNFIQANHLTINLSAFLLVFGAMAKSAQFPFHFWLPNTMETPTPVSAIMHAGIINAGGYLIVRFSPLLANTPIALSVLAIVGGFTAFWATIIMFTQTNVKRNLAYSTIAQMGFMMLQCGFGAFTLAVVHIVGHAFYKAYAFLSSGSATDLGRLNRYFPKPKVPQSLWAPFLLALCSITSVLGGLIYFGYDLLENPGITILLVILSLAISQIILNSNDKMKSVVTSGLIVLFYIVLSNGMNFILSDVISVQVVDSGAMRFITLFICTSFFLTLYLLQNSLEKLSETNFGKKLYVKALSGRLL